MRNHQLTLWYTSMTQAFYWVHTSKVSLDLARVICLDVYATSCADPGTFQHSLILSIVCWGLVPSLCMFEYNILQSKVGNECVAKNMRHRDYSQV